MDCSLLGTKQPKRERERSERASKRTEAQLFLCISKLLVHFHLLLLFGGYVIVVVVVVDSIFLGVKEFFIN